MLADEVDYVLGVDTDRDEHVTAVVTAPAGGVARECSAKRASRRSTLCFEVSGAAWATPAPHRR